MMMRANLLIIVMIIKNQQIVLLVLYYSGSFVYNFDLGQSPMEIQLKEFHNGKPIILNGGQDLQETIEKLRAEKKYNQILNLIQGMKEGKEKYLIAVQAWLGLRNWQKLCESCEKGLTFAEESQFYHLKGKALGKMGNKERQISLISKAITMNPYIPAYHRNLGAGYYAKKDYHKAIESHEKAIELEPNNGVNYHNLGSAFFRLNNFQKAIECFDEGIKRNPSQALSFSWKGDSLRELNRLQEAKECYRQAFELTHSAVYLKEKEKVEDMISQQSNKK